MSASSPFIKRPIGTSLLTLALLLSLSLVAIADINSPFQGMVHVRATGFENAKRIFGKYGGG